MIDLSHRLASLTPAKRLLLERRLKERPDVAEPIAIVGMACRFPGAPTLEAFWRVISEGIDATGRIPSTRWDIDRFYDPSGEEPGKMSVCWAGMLDAPDAFDPMFFGITPREAAKMDPQQRLLLEVAWEAMEQGGLAPEQLSGSLTGVFVGIAGTDYSKVLINCSNYYDHIDVHTGTGNALSIAANRLSYIFDFRGPSMAVDTACSSGLIGVHLGVQSLRNHECDAALAGGVNMILSPETTIAFSRAKMLSPDGCCRPFDAGANGYVRGEGCGMIILKRLTDAVRDRDNVLAVVRGSAVNQDGRTSGITAPNSLSQQRVIRAALAQAGLAPERVGYIEAHGTGTPLGDPIEVQSLGKVFRRHSEDAPPCYVTSVKANVGHMETVSGVAGLIKSVLMMKHRRIPAQLHLNRLNPNIALEGTRLVIPTEGTVWPDCGASRIAGVSSFGFGGANAHVVLEEATNLDVVVPRNDRPAHVLPLSAKTKTALKTLAGHYHSHIRECPTSEAADVCHSAATGRSHFNHRLAVVATDREELLQRLEAIAAGRRPRGAKIGQVKIATRPKVAMLFTGQGSQYVDMGRALYDQHPTFRHAMEQCDEILHELLDEPLLSVLYGDKTDVSPLNETAYTQPALFSLEYALATLWRSWGVEPAVLLGHSVGEYVAACVAGVFSLEDGLQLIAHRARLMQQLPPTGLMAVIFASPDQVRTAIEPVAGQVAIAASNGPENTVISGESDAVRDLVRQFESAGMDTQWLTVSHAFHSPLMEPMLDEFEALAAQIDYQRPRIPIVSNLTGQMMDDQPPDAGYWRKHIRNGVLFAEGMEALASEQPDAILEVGPSASLLGMGRRCLPKLDAAWLPSLSKSNDPWSVMLGTLSDLYVLGVKIDWSRFDSPWPRQRLALPTYPFERSSHWVKGIEHSGAVAPAGRRGKSVHPLLGTRVPSALKSMLFEVRMSSLSPKYLADHQVQGSAVTPAAAYIEQGLAAAEQVFGPGNHRLENVSIQQAMFHPDGVSRVVQVVISPENHGQCVLEIYSRPADSEDLDSSWKMHACTTLHHSSSQQDVSERLVDLDEVRARTVTTNTREEFYEQVAKRGLHYGPTFQVLDNLQRSDRDALAEVKLHESVVNQLGQYHLHPALLDGLFQSMAGAVPLEADGTYSPYTYMPVGARGVTVRRPLTESMYIYAVRTSADDRPSPESVEGDVLLLDKDGNVLVELTGVRIQRLGKAGVGDDQVSLRDWLYQVRWVHRPVDGIQAQHSRRENETASSPDDQPVDAAASIADQRPKQEGTWIITADRGGVAQGLADRLHQLGVEAVLVDPADRYTPATSSNGQAGRYGLDPLAADDYKKLLDEVLGSDNTRLCAGVVHLWSLDVETPAEHGSQALDEARRLGCGSALQLLRQLARRRTPRPPSVWLVTCGVQSVDDTPAEVSVAQSPLWGLGRVAAMEHPELSCRLVDLDPSAETLGSVESLLAELAAPTGDDQVAFRSGKRHVAHLHRAADLLDEEETADGGSLKVPSESPFRLRLGVPGNFDSLRFEPFSRQQPTPGQVEVEVHAAGLNFSDVMKAMGLYPGIQDEMVPLGIECSGVVTSVGDGVDRFHVGDEVMGVVPYSFASHAITADYALVHKPAAISHDEACTIPITFMTAHYALCHLGRLERGERVLIHAGAGGVGLAAIQIAQHLGAEIFATAGSDPKREYLRSLGVQHVMNSRTLDFADEIMEITGREGVDIVLNSLPGDAITKSLACLRAYGRFLEIGKTDIYQNRMIGLLPFQDNLSYFAIDLDRMLRQRPDSIKAMFAEVMQPFESGVYEPLALTQFPLDQTVSAFRYMAQRKNIGKVTISLEDAVGDVGQPDAGPDQVRRDGSYLISGGLGALGMEVAEWLAARGAGSVILLSRREPIDAAAERIRAMRRRGTEVAVLQADVADETSLTAALQKIPADFSPIRGVVHAAGVLDDGLMFDMDLAQLDRVLAPKVSGAWNLHSATRDEQLDFFVLFSSVACVLGSPGQANYAAGNAFLDGLARYRQSLGLPAISINWGPWAGSGMATAADRSEQIQSRGLNLISTEHGLSLMGRLLDVSTSGVAVMDAHWSDLLKQMSHHRPSLLDQIAADVVASDGDGQASQVDREFLSQLNSVDDRQQVLMLSDYFAGELANIMGIDSDDLDRYQRLNTLGLDSLMAMELKNKLESQLLLNLPMARFLESPSVNTLAQSAAELVVGPGESQPSVDSTAEVAETWSPLLPLTSDDEAGRPVFCVHPAGGDIRCYVPMSQTIGEQRPVYAFRARGMESGQPPHASVEDLARDYIAAMRERQPEGPYDLVGWSTGGIFAYEMVRQLREADAPVGALVLIDSPMPSILRDIDLNDDAKFLYDLVSFSNRFTGVKMNVSYEQLRILDPEEQFETVLQQFKQLKVVPEQVSTRYIRRLVDVCKSHVRAIMSYQPVKLDHPIHVIRPQELGVLAEASGQTMADDLGWGSIVGDRLAMDVSPGDHFTMMTGDHAHQLATLLAGILETAEVT